MLFCGWFWHLEQWTFSENLMCVRLHLSAFSRRHSSHSPPFITLRFQSLTSGKRSDFNFYPDKCLSLKSLKILMARLAYLEMCFPCTILENFLLWLGVASVPARCFSRCFCHWLYKKQTKLFPQMFTFDSRVKKVSCACRPEFSITSLWSYVEDLLCFGIVPSLSERTAGRKWLFRLFLPLPRIFINKIRLPRIFFSCALFTGRVTN